MFEHRVIVALDEVNRSYGERGEIHALNDVSLRVEAGEFVSIVGASGSGKSTLLNVLGLLDSPSSGSYRLDGICVSSLRDHELARLRATTIGFIFQSFHLLDDRSVEQNIELAQASARVPRAARRAEAMALIEKVGLSSRAHHPTRNLSGGERQRVAIARALVAEPRLLLADEPTGNLDEDNTEAILGLLERIHGDGATIIMITHDIELSQRAGRQLAMSDGRLAPAFSV